MEQTPFMVWISDKKVWYKYIDFTHQIYANHLIINDNNLV
uniref:Uncharacterized protein n=1 Tax=virus sp. ct5rm7 TaxID=2827298 RepID=A0A8S5RGJ4_9VIRU|nr:MAG TPA: hypothetical protein [virus sp. ct5rm7]